MTTPTTTTEEDPTMHVVTTDTPDDEAAGASSPPPGTQILRVLENIDAGVKGLKNGLPKEYFIEGIGVTQWIEPPNYVLRFRPDGLDRAVHR